MDKELELKLNKVNISKTAYRALLIAKLISSRPMTKDEILDVLKNNPVTKSSCSFDSLRLTLNTLKESGCEITRPCLSNNYSYFITKSPFSLYLTESQIDVLNTIRDNCVYFQDWQLILEMNDLYKKIAKISSDDNALNMFLGKEPLKNINREIFQELQYHIKNKNIISVVYSSGGDENSVLKILPSEIKFENGHLYLSAYVYKYDNLSMLRIDKVKTIKVVHIKEKMEEDILPIIATYKLCGIDSKEFIETENDTIVETKKDFIIVSSKVYSKFIFLQNILSYGKNCEILTPLELRDELVELLLKIKSEYQNDD